MKYYVAVDIALRKSGVVILDESKNILYSGIIKVPAKDDLTTAVGKIYEEIRKVYTLVPADATEVTTILEDVAGFVHVRAALAIHAARTAAILAWHHSNYSNQKIMYYTPNEVKYWLTKKRGAKKDEVKTVFDFKFPQYKDLDLSEDEIDALILVLYHFSR